MQTKIPATVVTGFLGAGKTTLIRNMLETANGKRIALIINEFGDLGVDGGILAGCGIEGCSEDDVVELSNGCICCTVADDFLPAVEKLLAAEPAPDHIVIETSGLALPQPLVRAFNWPDIRTRVTVDGVVTVVDGKAVSEGRFAADEAAVDRQREADDQLSHETPLSELFEDQIACADMILVNKADLLGDAETAALAGKLKDNARKGVTVVPATHGNVPADILLGLGIGAEDDLDVRQEVHHHHDDHDDHHHEYSHDHHAHDEEGHDLGGHNHGHHDVHHDHHHHDHGHDAFESFIVALPEASSVDALSEHVAATMKRHDLLRVKGFGAVAGKPLRLVVQAVGPRITTHFDRAFTSDESRQTRLVVIGAAGLDRVAIAQDLGGEMVAAA